MPALARLVDRTTFRTAVFGLISLCAVSACKGGGDAQAKAGDAPKQPDAVPVEVAQAANRAIAASYPGSRTLEPRAESQVVAKTSGVALAVLVEEGQQVRAGQPLVRLDADRARLAVSQTEAEMRKLENNYRRAQQLVGQQMISANDVDEIRYNLENARAQYNLAQLELSYTTVVAPISGVVASRSIKTGNFVQINTPIFRIVDQSQLELTLDVPEREWAKLRPGQSVSLKVDALPGRSFEGRVDRVATAVDSGSGTFRVVCAFAGDEVLHAGMYGRVQVNYDQRAAALAVPRTALLDDDETDPAVFAVREDKAVRVPVKLGYLDGEWAEIREGLKAGDRVVTVGKIALREGSPVQVIAAAADKAAGVAQAAATGTAK